MKRFPHLLPAEARIWEVWYKIHGKDWDWFEYDVHVGKGVDPGPSTPEPYRSLAVKLTQKRIDVVGKRDGKIWLFEVKPDAGLSALGQLLAYSELYRRDFNYTGPLELAVVTTEVNDDERYVYEKHRIHVFEVGYV